MLSSNVDAVESAKPASAVHGAIAGIGVLAFIGSTAAIYFHHPFGDNLVKDALLMLSSIALAIFTADLFLQKIHLRPSTGLHFDATHFSLERCIYKYSGLLGSLAFIAFLYWLFPEYHGSSYGNYYQMLHIVVPLGVFIALPYFFFLDGRMEEPRDGYWHMGKAMALQWDEVDRDILFKHMLGWIVKGFFLPLMFTYMCGNIHSLLTHGTLVFTNFQSCFDFLYNFFFFVDVSFATLGYMAAFRIADTHVRSVEPTMLGWTVTLICYQPFWSLIGPQYLAYDTNYHWGSWLSHYPIAYNLWGSFILLLVFI
jgi:hypothetical protein